MSESAVISTVDEVKQVENFGKALDEVKAKSGKLTSELDNLLKNVKAVGRSNVDQLRESLAKLNSVSIPGVSSQVNTAKDALRRLENLYSQSGKSIAKGQEKLASELLQTVEDSNKRILQLNRSYQSQQTVAAANTHREQVQQARVAAAEHLKVQEAAAKQTAISSLSQGLKELANAKEQGKSLQSVTEQSVKKRLATLEASKKAEADLGLNFASATAQARRDKEQLRDAAADKKVFARGTTKLSLEETNALLGYPSASEVKSASDALKAEMLRSTVSSKQLTDRNAKLLAEQQQSTSRIVAGMRASSAATLAEEEASMSKQRQVDNIFEGEKAKVTASAVKQLTDRNAKLLAEQQQSTSRIVAGMRASSAATLAEEEASMSKQRRADEVFNAAEAANAKNRVAVLTEHSNAIISANKAAQDAEIKQKQTHVSNLLSQIDTANKAVATKQKEATAASIQYARNQSAAALNEASRNNASFTHYNPTTGIAGTTVNFTEKAPGISSALRALTKDMGDTHAAARGLASGMSLLWLTWGNMAPLLAGSAVSFGLRAIVENGAKVQNTLMAIKTLAGATMPEVAALNQQMLDMARTGPFGPEAIAEAMKTLSLAGLKAKEVYSAMPELFAFAVAGDTTVKDAAEALTTISTAYGISADNYGHVADVVAKAAAESKSSVESMSSAFKTASVINQQYGVSLEDTAVGLALLANAGIQGSAAGTALRNMYADLSGRTPKVTAALEKLKVQVLDTNGSMRDQGLIFSDLMKGMDRYKASAQIKILNDIFSERGQKEANALIDGIRKVIEETKKATGVVLSYAEAYEKLKENIKNSEGFSIIAAAEQGLTPLNQMRQVGTSLQAALVAAFNDIQPIVLAISTKLQSIFNSDGFRNGIKDFAVAVATGATALLSILNVVVPVGAALVALNYGIKVVAGAFVLVTEATAAYSAATGVAATATGVLSAAIKTNPIGLIVSAVLTAGAAWLAYKTSVGSAKEAHDGFSGSTFADLNKKLDEEADRLEKVNKARREGISLLEVEAKTALASAEANAQKDVTQAQSNLKAGQDYVNRLISDGHSGDSKPVVAALQRVKDLSYQVLEAERAISVEKAHQEYAMKRIAVARKEQNTTLPGPKEVPPGTEDWAVTKGAKGSRGRTLTAAAAKDHLRAIQDEGAAELAALNDKYSTERQVLEAQHTANLLSEGSYQAQLLNLITTSEASRVAVIQKENKRLDEERDRWMDEAWAAYLYDVEHIRGTEAEKADLREKRMEELLSNDAANNDKLVVAHAKNATDLQKIENDGYLRREKSAAEYAGKLLKLEKDQADAAEKNTRDKQHLDRVTAIERAYAFVTESSMVSLQAEKAGVLAAEDAQAKLNETLAATDKAIQKETASLEEFVAKALEGGNLYDTEFVSTMNRMQKYVDGLKKARDTAASKGAEEVGDAAHRAYQKVIDNDVVRLQKGTADAIETALWEGGTAGKTKLRDLIMAELRKPLRLIIDAVVNPIMGSILGGVGSMFGGAASANAAEAASSGVGNMATSALSSAAFSGSTLTGMGQYFATGFMNTVSGTGAAAGMSAGAAVGGANGAAMSVGSAMPYVAVALLAANALGLFRTTKKVGGGLMGTLGEGDIQSYDLNRKSGTLFGPDYSIANKQKSAWSEMIQNDWKLARKSIIDMADSLGIATDSVKNFSTTLGTDVIHPDTGGLGIKLDDLQGQNLTDAAYAQEVQKRIAAAILAGSDEMAQHLIGSWETYTEDLTTVVTNFGYETEATSSTITNSVTKTRYKVSEYARSNETAIETLTRLSTSLSAVNGYADMLGFKLKFSGLAAANAASNFVDLFGGLDAFNTVASGYYDKYYSDAEKIAYGTSQLTKSFADLNEPMPTTRAALREMIDTAERLGDTTLLANLMKLADPLDKLITKKEEAANKAAETATTTADTSAVDTYKQKTDSLLQEQATLQIELLKAQGLTAEATAAELANATAGLDAYQASLVTTNFQLKQQAKQASEKLTLDRAVLEAEGDTAALRALDLAALEPANQALQQRVWLLQDEKAATEAYWSAAETVLDKLVSAPEAAAFRLARITSTLAKAGVGSGDQAADAATLGALSVEDIKNMTRSYVALHGIADPTSAAVLNAAGALLDMKDAAKTAFESLKSSVYSSIDNYYDSASAKQFKMYILAEKLSAAGVSGNIDDLAKMLSTLSTTQIKDGVISIMQLPGASSEAKSAILEVGNSLLDMADASKTANKAIQDQVDGLMDYVKKLRSERAGLATPTELLNAKRDDYIKALALAKSGDKDAISKMPATAQEYIDAQKGYSASSSYTQAVVDQVIAEITSLASGISSTIPGFASGGYHSGGWMKVGETGPGYVYTPPSHIFNAGQTASMVSGGADTAEELRMLRLQFAELQRQQEEQTAAIIQHNYAAQAQNANSVVDGVSKSAKRENFVNNNRPELV